METESINVLIEPKIIPDVLKAYFNLRLPIVACLNLQKKIESESEIEEPGTEDDFHAVVISGYRYDSDGNVIELYSHDDRIGPYSKIYPVTCDDEGYFDFSHWKNEWINDFGYDDLIVQTLLIPVYPKIRVGFKRIYDAYLNNMQSLKGEYKSTLFLEELNNYKNYLLKSSIENKSKILIDNFPKYLWIVRIEKNGLIKFDYVFDATSPLTDKPLFKIKYT